MSYFSEHAGETAALLTAVFWTITALAFETASFKVGSMAVNVIRLVMAILFLSTFNFFYRSHFFPVDATSYQWFWLTISGLIGFVFGDLFLFKSYTIIGSRFSMLIMTLVPIFTAILGFIVLGENLSFYSSIGMFLTIAGISFAIFSRDVTNSRKFKLKLSVKGVFYAFCGALGQAVGLIISKVGMQDYDPFAVTQIRIIAGITGFIVLAVVSGKMQEVKLAFLNKNAMKYILIGAVFGPFLGVALSQYSIKYTETGIASTIMSLVPIFIIVPTVLIYKKKVTFWEMLGAAISVVGVSLFFI